MSEHVRLQRLAQRVTDRPGNASRRRAARRASAGRSWVRRLYGKFKVREVETSVCCVAVDLKAERPSEGFLREIVDAPSCCRLMRSMWLVSTLETTRQLYARLAPHLTNDAQLAVFRVDRECCTWLPENTTAVQWIERYVR